MTDDLPPQESARTSRRDKSRRTTMVVDGAALRHRPSKVLPRCRICHEVYLAHVGRDGHLYL